MVHTLVLPVAVFAAVTMLLLSATTVEAAAICQERCKVSEMDSDGVATFQWINRGENMTSRTDPCTVYVCPHYKSIENAAESYDVVNIQCAGITSCIDGKAPFRLPGGCCPVCEYIPVLEHLLPIPVNPNKMDSWGEWSDWTTCSRECGGGRQSRMRDCIVEHKAAINCSGDRVQIQDCNTHHCPIDGDWSDWTEWSDCSATCGEGEQVRRRSCTNPSPQYGGKDCEGEALETRTCHLRHCPVHCVWEAWSHWTECNVECGGGHEFRSRRKQVEKYGGLPCEGPAWENRTCNTHNCPIHGGWTVWSNWSDCSETCGNGTKSRHRSCTNPTPQYGGKDCIGESNQVQACFVQHCPVNCEWLAFSAWTPCSVSCDGGTSTRTRDFNPALHGGEECMGDRTEVVECNTQACPDPCVDLQQPCYSGVTCTKLTDTQFQCGACPRGLRGDGRGKDGCQPVDECSESSPCFPGAACQDLLEGYQCGECPTGYTGSGLRGYDLQDSQLLEQICEDVNECQQSPNGGCSDLRECENTMGSFQCGPCPPGFVEDGDFHCQFSDPCAAGTHNCQKREYCNNHAVGQFHCFCPSPLIGNGLECSTDEDLDGVPDTLLTTGCPTTKPCIKDNCPATPNSGQEDTDQDGLGDVCDPDIDNDGRLNEDDNCLYTHNPDQGDSDRDGLGNVCDNCQYTPNVDQLDTDWDGEGDSCDTDRDGDGILNNQDNCPLLYNPRQRDMDGDRWGDVCDNCRVFYNRDQGDVDQDGVGDACDSNEDKDKDGRPDTWDNCVGMSNADQLDTDEDGQGDYCDLDDDNDGHLDLQDNCPLVSNPRQEDINGNGIGDACEVVGEGGEIEVDTDGDKVMDKKDNAPHNKNIFRTDFTRHMTVPLSSGSRPIRPRWSVHGNGTEVRQSLDSDPGLLVGYDKFSSVEYTGTLYVDSTRDNDFVGIVFNYQSNRRFMLVSWKQTTENYWGRFSAEAVAGLQIQAVKSNTGPGQSLMNALWNNGTTKRQVRTLYHDPQNRGWEDKQAYRWNLQYSTQSTCMRLRVYNETGLFQDTGCVCDRQIRGGRLGLYVFSQEQVLYSNLNYRSLSPEQEAALAQCTS